jgi:hypothetical protein
VAEDEKKEEKKYSYLDFMLALKALPEAQGSLAMTEFMTALVLGRDKQEVFRRWITAANKITMPWL